MRLNIRNMVCHNCVRQLKQLLESGGYVVEDIGLGFADIHRESLTPAEKADLDSALASLGFQLIETPNRKLVEAVKCEVIRHINSTEPCQHTLSHCIVLATGHDYKSVSRIFSALEGRTIEKFYITAKIEKAKELLSYGDIPLTEIAYRLGYSSTAFLSRQFKQETGMSPTQYRHSRPLRNSLTDI